MEWPFCKKRQGPKTVNIFLGFFFMVNFCLGTGFLGVPFSFFYAGYAAAIPTLLLIAFVSWNCSEWELEVMARAQAITSWRKEMGRVAGREVSDSESEKETLIDREGDQICPKYEIRLTRKFEPTELCEVFLTRWMKYAYMVFLSIYCFLTGWSFTTVAGTAWASNIPFNLLSIQQCKAEDFLHAIHPESAPCWHAYQLCVFFFAVIVVPLSIVDLKEQAILQMILGVLRFATIFAIVVYCIVKLSTSTYHCNSAQNGTNNYTILSHDNDTDHNLSWIVFRFDWKGWLVSIPIFTYAFIIHQGIPALTHPIKEKHFLWQLMVVMFISAVFCYLSLGVVVPLWFKTDIQEIATLNWEQTAVSSKESWEIRALSFYLVLFPSLDVCSAYPLVVHTISNNIYTVLFGRDTSSKSQRPKRDWVLQFVIKGLSAILPIAAALFISNLVYVLKYAGLIGFFICFFFPTALQLSSMWACRKEFGAAKTAARYQGTSKSIVGENKKLYSVQSGSEMSSCGDSSKNSPCLKSASYLTPYSNRVLSHPIAVGIIGAVGVALFLLALVSLGVHPEKKSCGDLQ